MTATVATRIWQDDVWVGIALVGLTFAAWAPEIRTGRARRWWFVYVAGIFVYTLLRSVADDAGFPTQTTYAILFDRLMFFGTDPVSWLQSRLFSPDRVSPLDVLTVQVHWSFFLIPHIFAVAIFIWRRPLFPRYAVLVVGTMYAGLILFFLVPTAPPWLAAQTGNLTEGFRIMDFVGGKVNADTYRSFHQSLAEPNSVAAMPSIHMAVTFAMYLWARDHAPRLAWPLLAYCAVMAFSLVYLAEHYALDLLVGMLIAWLCHLAARRFVPATGAASNEWSSAAVPVRSSR
jgi:membrane-associated phospholipid phosphatase